MTEHTEIVVIIEGNRKRAVKVIVDAPYPEELDIQYLAQRAWLTRSKKLRRGSVTVKIEGIDR